MQRRRTTFTVRSNFFELFANNVVTPNRRIRRRYTRMDRQSACALHAGFCLKEQYNNLPEPSLRLSVAEVKTLFFCLLCAARRRKCHSQAQAANQRYCRPSLVYTQNHSRATSRRQLSDSAGAYISKVTGRRAGNNTEVA